MNLLQNMQKSYEGFGYGIKTVLQSQEPWRSDVIGVAAELIEVQPEYVVAIETALGGAAQNLVMGSSEAAKKAIAYLKPVSYTHLTLPTIYSVEISVVAVSLKKKIVY